MEEKKTTPNTETQDTHSDATEAPKKDHASRLFTMGSLSSMLSEKEQKSLLFYIAVGIILVEFAVTVGALITGIAGAEQLGGGKVQFNFPWTGYLVTVVVAPIIVILLVNLIGMGFYRAVHGEPTISAEQFDQMPEKARNFFSLVRGAPTIILFGGIVVLAAVLYYLDGAMSLLLKLGDSVETIVIWGTCGLVIAWCLSYCARMWLLYRTRRLEADYAYRREVLERTGLVILDGKNMLGSQEGSQYVVEHALPSGGQGAVVDMDALPEADKTCDAPVEVDANATPHADAEKDIVDAEIIEPKPVEPEVTVAAAELVVEPEPVAEPVAEPIAEPVVESVADAAVEIVEPEAVKPEPHVVEAQIVAPEAETIEPEAEIAEPAVGDSTPENIAFEPQTVAIVHIAVRAISDSKDAVIEPETESKPELTLEPEPELIPEPAVDVVLAELVSEPELESNLEATPEPTLELKPEPISESIPEPVVQTDIPVTKPSAPQSPQTPQEPKVVVANPKPPVRHARLSDRQKRR